MRNYVLRAMFFFFFFMSDQFINLISSIFYAYCNRYVYKCMYKKILQ